MASAYILSKVFSCLLTHICCEMHPCFAMLLNCVVFPIQQGQKNIILPYVATMLTACFSVDVGANQDLR